MPNKTISTLVTKLYNIKQERLALVDKEKAILEELKPLVDPLFDASKGEPIPCNGVVLTRTPSRSTTLSADLLLDRGVSAEVIAYAAKIKKYFQYRVKADRVNGKKAGKANGD